MRLDLKPLYIFNDELHKYSILIPSVSKIVNILVPKDFSQIDENILKLAQNRGICLHNMIDVWIKNNFDDELIEFIDCEIKSHRELFKNFTKGVLYDEPAKNNSCEIVFFIFILKNINLFALFIG
ncbi:hypothetical protein [Spiroplasma endosymbiont of Seladonia tumulorum]|uniref:hypothetical protein n=1 Tax=Spiroplasma endosymbiont of Seladonia tumulorum TaxID=3066321 RepID=UPI0030D4EFFB